MVLIVALVPATVLVAIWLLLLAQTAREDWVAAAFCKVLSNREQAEKLSRKDEINAEKLAQYNGLAEKVAALFLGDHKKEIKKLQKDDERLQNGDLRSVSIFAMPGYVIQRKFDAVGHGAIHREILSKCIELYGKKYAPQKANQMLAQLLSYPVIGVAASLALGALLVGAGATNAGLAVMGVGTLLVIVLVYALYDELSDQLKKRRAAISRQFPNVVSKLALLVTSGMIVDKAWRETAESESLELYQEMRKTADELSNLVDPATAYTNFINRCNTKETTKLASAIIQGQSKGNAEIGALLKGMAHEAWQERRHTAKRDAEAANSKLMIPTMLLFLAILVMIMVPVMMSFSGF